MAAILDNVVKERISADDFKVWLISDSLESSTEKADFIPYFLNYVRENCAWLLSKNGKILESPSTKPLRSDNQPRNVNNDLRPQSSQEIATSNLKSISSQKRNEENVYKNDKHILNYDQNFLQDGYQIRGKYNSEMHMPYEENKKTYNERNNRKSDFSARKSLNFHSARPGKSTTWENNNIQAHIPDISSYDAFPPVGTKDNRNFNDPKTRRRITPTPIQAVHKGSSKFGNPRFVTPAEKVSNEFFKQTPVVEMPSSDLRKEREMLKMTRNQLLQSATLSNNFNNLRVENTVSPTKPVTVNYVTPDPDKISHIKELEKFSIVYDLLISSALVPNVTSELYFIFELITSKVLPTEKSDNKNSVFSSIHNCMFFATTVLSKLTKFLYLLDNNTLHSLSEIPYMLKFSSNLVEYLRTCSKEKQEVPTKSQSLSTVPFILEEDSSENFLDNHAFTSFRKQRDLFYELLRDWQQQPLDCIDSKFRDSFYRKAKNLISIAPNAINIHHLAKLFQNQLIASCLGLEVSEVYDELLSDIQKNFPGKIEKLHQRFMMPFCIGGPSPPPSFYGAQAFFSELIQAAASASLNQHLQDIFISKILELNSSEIFSDTESSSLGTMKEKYIFLLHTLRLLGKFLGFLYFLPYKVTEPLSSNILSHQLGLRKYSAPPIDILKLLKSAFENRRAVLTIPWIVEFFSMADPVGKSLPYVEETLEILTAVYRGKYFMPTESLNFWFLRVIIGWLFDVLCYPIKYNNSVALPTTDTTGLLHVGIDSLAVVDKQLIHSCCPYLVEFKVLVYSFLNGIRKDKKREVRKITPLSTSKPSVMTSAKQQIQVQLEENFFFLHPPSLKKTVEFVAERMASKVIQKIRSEVTDFKLQSVDSIRNQETYKVFLSSPSKSKKKEIFVDSCILDLYNKSHSKIEDFIHITCPKDIENILPSLLSDDIKPPVLKMCCEISFRFALEKIIDWCDVNLLFEDIKCDIKNKLNHLSKGEVDNISEDDFDVSSLLTLLRGCILKNFLCPDDASTDYTPLLAEVLFLMNKPIGNSTKKLISFLTVDLYISLLVNCPKKCSTECDKSLILIWSACPENFSLDNYFLGVQNIKLMLTGKDLELSCTKLDLMLNELVNNNVFSAEKLINGMKVIKLCQWKDPKAHILLQYVSNILLKLDTEVPNKVSKS